MVMNFDLVLIERCSTSNFATCAVLINEEYVISTGHLFTEELTSTSETLKELHFNKTLRADPFGRKISVNVVTQDKQDKNLCHVKQAYVKYAFVSNDLSKTVEDSLKGWRVDSSLRKTTDLRGILSVFFVLTFDDDIPALRHFENLRQTLIDWSELITFTEIQKCGSVLIKSAPFANRLFMNSYSKGIVSNKMSSLLLSDCTTAIGCEGSPAFINNCKYPNGIVLSSDNWWRGERTGCTFMVDLKEVLREVVQNCFQEGKSMEIVESLGCGRLSHPVLASSELSLVQVYSGISWGTGILLDQKHGVFITNSHVIGRKTSDITIAYKGRKYVANLIYKTPEDEVYDVALLECKCAVAIEGLKSIEISKQKCELGMAVFSAGFPFFPEELLPSPTVSRGCVSKWDAFYLRTTCAVHSGDSGGAILDGDGALLAVIVSNTVFDERVFPRVNLSVPYGGIRGPIDAYLGSGDPEVLKEIHVKHGEGRNAWKVFDSKL